MDGDRRVLEARKGAVIEIRQAGNTKLGRTERQFSVYFQNLMKWVPRLKYLNGLNGYMESSRSRKPSVQQKAWGR